MFGQAETPLEWTIANFLLKYGLCKEGKHFLSGKFYIGEWESLIELMHQFSWREISQQCAWCRSDLLHPTGGTESRNAFQIVGFQTSTSGYLVDKMTRFSLFSFFALITCARFCWPSVTGCASRWRHRRPCKVPPTPGENPTKLGRFRSWKEVYPFQFIYQELKLKLTQI